jgi:phage gp36-like protein
MFIQKSDLRQSILIEELDEITRNNTVVIDASMSAAIAEARMYLFDTFDTDAIFNATGNNRNALIVQLTVDMAVYKIVATCQAGIDMADRLARYEMAVRWLRAAAKTEIYADLPRRADNATAQTNIVYGSNPKRGNYY